MQHEDKTDINVAFESYDVFPVIDPENEEQPTAIDITDDRKLVGYAVVWGAISGLRLDGFRHRFNRGSIKWADRVNALWQHDYARPLASTANGTLTITEDDHGAKVEMVLDDSNDGKDALLRVKNKLVSGMSFSGTRKSFKRAEGNVIDVTSFTGVEVSLTIIPGMIEAAVVHSSESEKLSTRNNRASLNKLSKAKLTLLTAGRVSA